MDFLEGSDFVNRFKKTIVPDIKKEIAFTESQELLKEKYKIENQDVVVVEKSNAYKFTINAFVAMVKLVATIILLVLAAIGLMSLIYPNIRAEVLIVMNDILMQLKILLR